MKEYLDVLDSKMNIIGKEERKTIHEKGLWHQTFHCWIIKKIGGTPYLLMQRRDKSKKVGPNTLDITAAGHLSTGETPISGGIREIKEELGIEVSSDKIIPLGIRIAASEKPNNINKEFCHVYFLEHDADLDDYEFLDGEVSGLVEIPIEAGLKLFTNETDRISCNAILVEDGQRRSQVIEVRESDFLPRGIQQPYYLKILIMAERYFEGRKGITI